MEGEGEGGAGRRDEREWRVDWDWLMRFFRVLRVVGRSGGGGGGGGGGMMGLVGEEWWWWWLRLEWKKKGVGLGLGFGGGGRKVKDGGGGGGKRVRGFMGSNFFLLWFSTSVYLYQHLGLSSPFSKLHRKNERK